MALSDRDRKLVWVLPALVVVVGYCLFFLKGKLAELDKITRAVEAAQQAAPAVELVQEQQRILEQLAKDLRNTKIQIEECKARCRTLIGGCASAERRNERMDRLTQLLKKHDLDLAEDREADAGKEGKLAPALEKLTERIAELSSSHKPQLRVLRFHGRYADVRQTLQVLGDGDVLAIPVGLTMKTTADPQRREWTLLVWI